MVSNITLTSSMRSNLSSLKSLASQMSTTQTRLSTGKKVNNAIDNANSYYQARALTNRASDLDMLLDSMGQSIQTITSAVKGLESSGEILENAAVIAKQAYEAEKTITIPATKEYFAELVGENGAVVSTAQELKDAIAANKEMICVYGKVDYFENETLTMKAGQKLVGTEYFTGYTGNKKFSEINFSGTQDKAIVVATSCLISDLSLNFESYSTSTSQLISVSNSQRNVNIANIDINHNSYNQTSSSVQGSIVGWSGTSINLLGNINITTNKVKEIFGVYGTLNIANGAKVNVDGKNTSWGLGTVIVGGIFNVYGELNAKTNNGMELQVGGHLNIYQGGVFNKQGDFCFMLVTPQGQDSIYMADGAKMNLKDAYGTISLAGKDITKIFPQSTSAYNVKTINFPNYSEFDVVPNDIDWDNWNPIPERGDVEEPTRIVYDKEQFDTTLTSFDEMVSDSSYQGVNLLKGGKLTTMFNEDRTHSYTVEGKDMSLSGLGITTREWATKDDIAASIKEIQNAMSSIRDEVARLGNNLSIIETRMNFTDGLVDVLQTGADDLVLADMNEESANYLALQTRNSLAVNALALAAQSNNSVLNLF